MMELDMEKNIHRVLCKICATDIVFNDSEIKDGKVQCPCCMNEIEIDKEQ